MTDFLQPHHYPRDWYGHLVNQCGHMVLGVAVIARLRDFHNGAKSLR
jgi:hypothetical protein